MELKGSKTEKNLLTAFAWESQERNQFTFFSKNAEKEGYHQISRILMDIAEHERIHAKNFFRNLPAGKAEITSTFFSGEIRTTGENLKVAIESKCEISIPTYGDYAQVARDEGFEEIARLFHNTIVAEKFHSRILKKFLKLIDDNTVWVSKEPVEWVCVKCGFTVEAKEPPGKCSACDHPKEYFEMLNLNF